VFRTHPSEKSKLVFQIGSANAELALEAALTVAQDVSAIDLNCGCPKRFSIHGGMGAALMEEPEKLCGILRKLVEHSGLPVTCKIRIFPDREQTLKLVKMIEATGIKALAVHCRYRDERPREKGHWDRFKEIVEAVSIPVIANGDVWDYEHLASLKELSGVTAVMYARRAEANVSIFRKEGPLPLTVVVKSYIRKCLETRNHHANSKYCLMQMFIEDTKDPRYRPLCNAKSFRAVMKVFDMEPELDAWMERQRAKGYPTDLDTVPRKAGAALEEAAATNGDQKTQKQQQQQQQQQGRGKRKLEQAHHEENKDQPVAKKHVAEVAGRAGLGDGSASQPTPADTPQPEEGTDVKDISSDTLPSAGAEQQEVQDATTPAVDTTADTASSFS